MTKFFSADFHAQHTNIREYCPNRPGDTTEDMTNILINNWNSVVMPDDEMYFLGDLLMGHSINWESILNRLNGKIYLIAGNHDKKLRKRHADRFEWIKDYYELKVQDSEAPNGKSQLIVMCHYPLLSWNHASHGSIMLHGHCHNSMSHLNENTRRLDVGLDNPVCNYKPLSYQQIKKIMSIKTYQPVDHHGKDSNLHKEAIC